VSLKIRCRHTIGLNYSGSGSSVGTGRERARNTSRYPLAAAHRLLMDRFGISIGDVIGHNEA
jgi:hypothetical protein